MTTSTSTNSTATAQVITLARRGPIRKAEVERTLAELLPRIEAGDGPAMLAGVEAARRWLDGYQRTCDALHMDSCDWLTHGWCDMHEAVARAPVSGPPSVLAKVRVAHYMAVESGCDYADWLADLHRTMLAGVQAMIREAGHV